MNINKKIEVSSATKGATKDATENIDVNETTENKIDYFITTRNTCITYHTYHLF